MMENSYLRQVMTSMILVIATNSARVPKASGKNSRVRIGATSIPRHLAYTLPEISFRTFAEKLVDMLDTIYPIKLLVFSPIVIQPFLLAQLRQLGYNATDNKACDTEHALSCFGLDLSHVTGTPT
jgi:hypothetical protein